MINRLQLLRNVGSFDSVNSGASIPLNRLTLVYAENGRGKTTLAAILRSLATGNSIPIAERRRLAAQHPPHVVLDCSGGPPEAMFHNNAWNRTLPNMAVFDDVFVDQNVYSGLAVEPEHRQNLHELILGAQGVTLNQRLQQLVTEVEGHNTALRTKAAAVPAAERGALSVDQFCALSARADIEAAIHTAERNLAAATKQDSIRAASLFGTIGLPDFDLQRIEVILRQDLPSLDATAADRVQVHMAGLGQGGENWVAEGMLRFPRESGATSNCPFCAQDLAGSPLINHYRAYFSNAYADLKRSVSELVAAITRGHDGDVPVAFERTLRVIREQQQFWSRFSDVPDVVVDTERIAHDWRAAREALAAALNAKQTAPLEPIALSDDARVLITTYEAHRQTVAALNQRLQEANTAIHRVKERSATANATSLAADLARLQAIKARNTLPTEALCAAYLAEKAAKTNTERLRDQARAALEQYRANRFPAYQDAINLYLQRFNAGFRLSRVSSANTRAGSTCTYDVVINDTPVAVAGGTPPPGEPAFRNTLSAGDRNTLALAFFFASLDQDPALGSKVVVIDDPIASLDEHRSRHTVQETRRLTERVAQVIVLSHSKPFLCRIWEDAPVADRAAVEIARDGLGSILQPWNVNQDCITEHDRRHSKLREYLASSTPNNLEVVRSIRPSLEAFLRVAFPEHFIPGTLLGPFRALCEQRVNTPLQILNAADTRELRDLIDYANQFHHDSIALGDTVVINDGELLDFVRRALDFMKR